MNMSDDAVPIRKLDDATLVQKFVEGDSALLANQSLRVETTFDAVALMAKKEGVIATVKEVDRKRVVLVRYKSQYWQLVHNALLTQSYVPTNYPDQQGFIQYQKQEIPPGYQVNYAEARFLWKEWWVQRRKYSAQSIQLDLLIFTRGKWYPIREIISNEGVLFITTLVGDTILSGSDQVAWLSRVSKPGITPGVVSQMQSRRVIQPTEATLSESSIIQTDLAASPATPSFPLPNQGADAPTADLNNPPPPVSNVPPARPPFIPGVTGRGVGAARSPVRAAPPGTGGPAARKAPPLDAPTAPLIEALPVVTPPGEQTIVEWPEAAPASTSPPQPVSSPASVRASEVPAVGVEPSPQPYPDVAPLVDIGAVLRFGQGRLYISTTIGELVVEGNDLKFWLTRSDELS